jgi:hypothetical protein
MGPKYKGSKMGMAFTIRYIDCPVAAICWKAYYPSES